MFKCGKKIQCKTISSFFALIDEANSRRRLSPINQSSLLCNFKFSKRGQLLFFKTSNSSKIYPFTLRKPSKKKKYCKPQYNFGKKCGIFSIVIPSGNNLLFLIITAIIAVKFNLHKLNNLYYLCITAINTVTS